MSIELVVDPSRRDPDPGSGLSHFVIQVESLDATLDRLATRGITAAEPGSPDGSADFRTTLLTDPDGNRIELVQWPPGHPDGMTAADFSD